MADNSSDRKMSDRPQEKKFSHTAVCQKTVVIGLIGDIAGGKTTVSRRLAARGAGWIDADRLAHRCLGLPWVRRRIRETFGESVFGEGERVDRRQLASRVFGADAESERRLQSLQRIIHPPTRQLALRQIERFVRRGVTAVVLDAPLLVEAGWDLLCDEVWCVSAPRSRRIQWAMSRGWSEEELAARESRQWKTADKEKRSTVIVENNTDRSTLLHRVDRLFEERTNISLGSMASDDQNQETGSHNEP